MKRLPLLVPVLMGGGKFKLPFSDNFTRADGALGGKWTGSTWTISSNAAVCTPVTFGLNKVTNGTMEADSDWASAGTPTTNERSNEQAHAGTYSRKVISDGVMEGATQNQVLTGYTWWEAFVWLYVTAGSAKFQLANLNSQDSTAATAAEWVKRYQISRSLAAATKALAIKSGVAVSTFYADDASVRAMTISELFATLPASNSNITAKVAITLAATANSGIPAGLVLCLDSRTNPQNYLLAYHNGNQALLEKCVGGTYTNLIATGTGATYGAGKVLKVVKSGTTVQLFYGAAGSEAQIGVDQTLSSPADDAVINGKIHGMFSTYSGTVLDSFSLTSP